MTKGLLLQGTRKERKWLYNINKTFNKWVYPPMEMQIPFSADEIEKVAQRLKKGKSNGIDQIFAEYINYIYQKNCKRKLEESPKILQKQEKIHWI